MRFINPSPQLVYYLPMAIGILSVLALVMIALLIGLRAFRNRLSDRGKQRWKLLHGEVFSMLIDDSSLAGPSVQLKKKSNRDYLLALYDALCDEKRTRLRAIYIHCGFAHDDYESLQSSVARKRSAALRRLRRPEIALPDAAWRHLIADVSPIFRWGVMEHILAVKKSKSLPWLFAFIFHPNNYNRRVMVYFFSILAATDRSVLLTILKHCDDESAIESSLRVLAAYPSTHALVQITAMFRCDWHHETVIAALQSLLPYHSAQTKSVYYSCVKHHHWVVRMLCARGLKADGTNETVQFLKQLAEDSNYYVRREALTSLLALSKTMDDVLVGVSPEKAERLRSELQDSKDWLERVAS